MEQRPGLPLIGEKAPPFKAESTRVLDWFMVLKKCPE